MKRLIACLALGMAAASLGGCYYDPGYSYTRATVVGGDAYYGAGTTAVYDDGYYAAPGYYGYAPSVSIGFNSFWYGHPRYYGGYYGYYRGGYYGRRYYGHGYYGHGYYGHGYYGHGYDGHHDWHGRPGGWHGGSGWHGGTPGSGHGWSHGGGYYGGGGYHGGGGWHGGGSHGGGGHGGGHSH